MTLGQLRRIRWAVRAVLLLGVAASVTANVLHAEPNPIAEAIAAWPPLALLLTVELISRIPVHRRGLAAVRIVATAVIAGIAAWVSYWHMTGVAARYGEAADAAHLIPFSVDGLVVVASVCLVELAGRLRDLDEGSTLGSTPVSGRTPEPAPIPEGSEASRTPDAEVPPVPLPPIDPVPALVMSPPVADELPEDPEEVPATLDVAVGAMKKPRKAAVASAPRRPFVVTQKAAASMEAGGMSVPEIASALGISPRQVRTALRPVPVDGGER
jgi:hypothetical protein